MAPRTARTSTATANPPEPPPPAEEELLDLAQSPDENDKVYFFDYLKTLDDRVLAKSVVYVYRIRPRIKKAGVHNIDKYAANLFSEDQLKEDHGGGRYSLKLDTGVKASNLSRTIDIPGPALIFPEEILVDEQGNPRPIQPAGAAAPAPADDPAKSELVASLRLVTEALQKNSGSPQQAMQEAFALMKQANSGAMEIVISAAKNATSGNGSAADKEVLSEIRNLATAIRDMKKGSDGGVAEKIMDAAVDRFLNPPAPAPAPDLFDGLKKIGDAFGSESGGGLGVLRTLLGGQKESFWEGVGKDIFSGISTAVRENFPSIMQWMRERAWYSYVEKIQHQAAQPGGPPATQPPPPGMQPPAPPAAARVPLPPAPPAHTPAARPAPAPGVQPPPAAAPDFQPGPGDTEMLNLMQREITALIRRTWDMARRGGEDPDGGSAAIVVKLAYPAVIPFIRAQFNDLEKLKLLAAADPVLGPIASDPAFPEFAEDFFEELHDVDGTEPTAGTA